MTKLNFGVAAAWMGAIATAFTLTTTPVRANDLTEIFADPNIPLTLKLGALDNNWKRLQLDGESLGPSPFLFGMSGILESALRTNVYYTQGQTVTLNKQQFLIVYRPDGRNIDLADLMRSGRNNTPESLVNELTSDSQLNLSLINLSTVKGLKDIQPFNLQKEIEDSKQDLPEEDKTAKPTSPAPSPAEPTAKPAP